jgi:hypothetical protein
MFRVPLPHLLVVTNDVRLGEIYSSFLVGPTPAQLSLGVGDRLPFGVRPIAGSLVMNNWRTFTVLQIIAVFDT